MMMTPYVAGGICDGLHQLRICGNPQNSDIFKKKWRPQGEGKLPSSKNYYLIYIK